MGKPGSDQPSEAADKTEPVGATRTDLGAAASQTDATGTEATVLSKPDRAATGVDATLASPGAPVVALAPLAVTAEPSRYQQLGEIARGGMGRILAAHDRKLQRPVAIKELIAADPALARRFEREALITARLQHPAIVNLHEAGRWPSGEPFFVMKRVQGSSLKEVVARAQTLNDRISLVPKVIAIADAMAYAHTQRIVHRDLKPANVLVGDYGETVVIDWGLAKDLNGDAEDPDTPSAPATNAADDLTVAGAIMGTPGYMAPEQASGAPADERTDVYALGAILYYVLTGAPPYHETSASLILSKLLESTPAPIGQRQPDAPRELVAVVERAMARAPRDRYPSAREFAEELRRFQTGQLVAAHAYTRGELARRWIARHRTVLSVVTAGLTAATIAGVIGVRGIMSERDRAAAAERHAVERADGLTLAQARTALDHDPGRALTVLRELSPGSPAWGAARVIAADALSRGVPQLLEGHRAGVVSLAVSSDGAHVASGGSDGAVWLWDPASGSGRELGRHDKSASVTFAPGGQTLISYDLHTVRVWDVATGSGRVVLGNAQGIIQVDCMRPGLLSITTLADGLKLLDLASGTTTSLVLPTKLLRNVVFSPDGAQVAIVELSTVIYLLDVSTGATRTLTGHSDLITALAFSPDGKTLASGARDRTVRLWDLAGDGSARLFTGHEDTIEALQFSPDGATLASASRDRTARLWTLATGASTVLSGHTAAVTQLAFAPDGARLATGSADSTVRIWDVASRTSTQVLHEPEPVAELAFVGASMLATHANGPTLRLWRPGAPHGRVLADKTRAFALSGAGSTVAIATVDQRLLVEDLERGGQRVFELPDEPTTELRFSPDGATLAARSSAMVSLWNVATGEHLQLAGLAGLGAMVFSHDGRRLAVPARFGKDILVWEVGNRSARRYAGLRTWPGTLALSPDGRFLAAGDEKHVRLWDLDRDELRVLDGHTDEVGEVAFSTDGRTLISASRDKTVRLWGLATGEVRVLHQSASARVLTVAAARIATSDGNQVRLWDTRTGESRILSGHHQPVRLLAFSPDGGTLVSDDGNLVRTWDVSSGEGCDLAAMEEEINTSDAIALDDARRLLVQHGSRLTLFRDDLPTDPVALRARLDELTATKR